MCSSQHSMCKLLGESSNVAGGSRVSRTWIGASPQRCLYTPSVTLTAVRKARVAGCLHQPTCEKKKCEKYMASDGYGGMVGFRPRFAMKARSQGRKVASVSWCDSDVSCAQHAAWVGEWVDDCAHGAWVGGRLRMTWRVGG
eukprot:5086553-Prymnesium_polylepis.3